MSVDANIRTENKVVGIKQSMKSVVRNKVQLVYVARDADCRILSPLVEFCRYKDIDIIEMYDKVSLGKICGINTATSAVAILKKPT